MFYDGMEEDVVPGLVAIGFPEAEAAYATVVAELESRTGVEGNDAVAARDQ